MILWFFEPTLGPSLEQTRFPSVYPLYLQGSRKQGQARNTFCSTTGNFVSWIGVKKLALSAKIIKNDFDILFLQFYLKTSDSE